MQKLIVALTLLFGGIAANDRDGHSRLLRGRGKTVDYPEAGKTALSRQDAGDEPVRAAARRLATVTEGIPPECVLAFEAVTKDGSKLKDFPACIDNLVVVTEAVLNKPASFADAGPTAQDSILIQMIAKNKKPDTVIPFDDAEEVTFKSSDVFALPAVAKNGLVLEDYPESKDNLIVVMQAVLQNRNAFPFAGCHAQSDLLIQLVATAGSATNMDLVQQGCGEPTPVPTAKPTAEPTAQPTAEPTTAEPTPNPTAQPTPKPTYDLDTFIGSSTYCSVTDEDELLVAIDSSTPIQGGCSLNVPITWDFEDPLVIEFETRACSSVDCTEESVHWMLNPFRSSLGSNDRQVPELWYDPNNWGIHSWDAGNVFTPLVGDEKEPWKWQTWRVVLSASASDSCVYLQEWSVNGRNLLTTSPGAARCIAYGTTTYLGFSAYRIQSDGTHAYVRKFSMTGGSAAPLSLF